MIEGKDDVIDRRRVEPGCRRLDDGRFEFIVWAPDAARMELSLAGHRYTMEAKGDGYWSFVSGQAREGDIYTYSIDGGADRPDPASYSQPGGVHGPSRIVDHTFPWSDGRWSGIPLKDMILYELHIGTFTAEGTFTAALGRLDDIARIGINAVEIMPVAQFPGERSWGYDGVNLFAVQNSYGSPRDFKALLDVSHRKGIAVILDVVYNHLGPEGNYLSEFGPYFTDRYRTPWGKAVNFDGPYSNEVRNFFIENALYWLREYHLDGLRLDAIHGIFDQSACPFLAELSEEVRKWSMRSGRRALLIAESDLNDSRVVTPCRRGGFGFDAQWSDDFHHALHGVLTGERQGYYGDFGKVEDLIAALRDGCVYQGQYSRYRKRNHGSCLRPVPSDRLVVFCQNHDQIGNRMTGERLAALLPFEGLKLAAAVLLTSPYIPLLFMGEEYGEDRPFLYFVSHSDPDLVRAVREGRKEEFKEFLWQGEPPDPDGIGTFLASKIEWEKREAGKGRQLLNFFGRLIELRKEIGCLVNGRKKDMEVHGIESSGVIISRRWGGESSAFCVFNTAAEERNITFGLPKGSWVKVLDSDDKRWGGPGAILPDRLTSRNESLSIRGYGFSLYEGRQDDSDD